MKKDKTKLVYVLIPNDFEFACQYFDNRDEALAWARTYESGAYVSTTQVELSVKTLERAASRGYRI